MSLSGEEKRARLEKALAYGGGTHRMDDVVRMLKDGDAKLYENSGGCIITEVISLPLIKCVNYWLAAGELRACLALQDEIDAAAIRDGCEMATITGRRGWGRAAALSGWRLYGYTFWKPLNGPEKIP